MSAVDEDTLKKSVKISQKLLDDFKTDAIMALPEIFTKNGITLVTKVAMITPPMTKSSNPSASLKHDILNIFVPLKSIPFRELVLTKQWSAVKLYDMRFDKPQYNKWVNEENWNQLYRLFSKHGESPDAGTPTNIVAVKNATHDLHRRARLKKGSALGPWDKKTRFHVANYKESVIPLIEDAKKKVGSMVGGWVQIINKLGGIIGSVPKEYRTRGNGTIEKKWDYGKSFSLTMTNDLGDYNGYLSSTRYGDTVKIVKLVGWMCVLDIIKVMNLKGDKLK